MFLIDSGFTQAIIRDDNPSQQDLSTVFFFNFIMSIILYAILFCLSPYIATFFDAPELELLSKVVFLVIVFNSVSIIQNAMLNRELRFAWVAGATALFVCYRRYCLCSDRIFGIWRVGHCC